MKQDFIVLKDQLLIPCVWQRLGLPGNPGPSCRAPWRRDSSPSFSVYADGRRWKDFATGEGGDVVDFIARACGIDGAEAARRFFAMAGVAAPISAMPSGIIGGGPIIYPTMHRGSSDEIIALARSRRLDPAAISLAQGLGTVAFGNVCGFPSWILSDRARRVAEARRVDGKPFPSVGKLGERKSHALKGSKKGWPAGVGVLKSHPVIRTVMMVEGGPDYLAALHFAISFDRWNILPVAMLGRGVGGKIDPAALDLLGGCRIRIYPHIDPDGGGLAAAETWAAQLHSAGCDVEKFDFTGLVRRDGRPVKDLNDAVVVHPNFLNELSDLLP